MLARRVSWYFIILVLLLLFIFTFNVLLLLLQLSRRQKQRVHDEGFFKSVLTDLADLISD